LRGSEDEEIVGAFAAGGAFAVDVHHAVADALRNLDDRCLSQRPVTRRSIRADDRFGVQGKAAAPEDRSGAEQFEDARSPSHGPAPRGKGWLPAGFASIFVPPGLPAVRRPARFTSLSGL